MSKYLTTSKTTGRSSAPVKKASLLDRMAASQEVVDLPFMDEPSVGARTFQECIAILYGCPGVSKTTFACNVPGMYLIDSENKSQWQERRATYVPNWVSFRKFIDNMEANPEQVATVKMWGIDTIDVLVDKGMSTICIDRGLTDLSEEGYARAWQDLRAEVVFQILRLRQLGPGVLLVSHEREVEIKRRHIAMDHTRMDVSKSIFNALSNIADLTIRMGYTAKDTIAGDVNAERCLITRGSEEADAKNCTSARLEDKMAFRTEREAVNKILAAFAGIENGGKGEEERSVPAKKKVAKKKVVKRVKRTEA